MRFCGGYGLIQTSKSPHAMEFMLLWNCRILLDTKT